MPPGPAAKEPLLSDSSSMIAPPPTAPGSGRLAERARLLAVNAAAPPPDDTASSSQAGPLTALPLRTSSCEGRSSSAICVLMLGSTMPCNTPSLPAWLPPSAAGGKLLRGRRQRRAGHRQLPAA